MRITLNIILFWAVRMNFYCICFFLHISDAYVDYDLCSFVNLWLNWDQLASSLQIAGSNSPLDLYRCYPYFLVDHRTLHHVDIQSNWLFKIKCNILIIKGTVHPKMNVCWKITYHSRCTVVFLSKQIWRNVALHHLLTNRSSAVNGCRQNDSPNIWLKQ